MADIRHLRQNRKCKNFISAFVATYKTGEALETFTEQGLLSVHNHIKQTLGNMPACGHHCSQNYRDLNRWCVTCTSWRIELENVMPRGIRRIWHDKKSWGWPNSAQEITEVFLLPGWNTNNINLKDISTIFNVWNRCLQFPRHVVQVLENLKESRNDLVHNTVNMKLTNARKKAIFQNISNVVNHPDIQPSIPNNANLLQTLRDLKQGKLFQDDVVYTLNHIGKQNADIKAKLDRLALTLDDRDRTFGLQLIKLQKRLALQNFAIPMFMVFAVAVVFCLSQHFIDPVCTMLPTTPSHKTGHYSDPHRNVQILTSTEGCLSETSSTMPYGGQISLFEYIAHHNDFVGRTWLIGIIRKELLTLHTHNRGIILEAGMGYGKSALIKHIICSSDENPTGKIRSRLVAYHVCRFDVLISKLSFVFVLRLIDMISSQMPFLEDEIKSCTNIFNRNMCERDPNGCLDQCLIIPLKNISYSSSEPVIIAIDGLDECFDNYRDMNEILLTLKQRLHQFPSWVKFLVSSRPDSRIRHLASDLLFMELNDESEDNLNDISKYLQQLSVNRPDETEDNVDGFNISNFLVLSLLKDNIGNEAVGTIFPTSLDRYYDEQFNRLFKTKVGMAYEEAKVILEVMFATFQSPSKENIWNVVSNATDMTLKQYDKTMQLLDNFIRKIGNELHLIHISLQQWLMSADNVDFSIDIEYGHELNAKYIIKLIENGFYESDIVDLAIHVGISSSGALRQRFLKLSADDVESLENDTDEYPLVRLARRVDSSITTDILISHFKTLDHRSKDNQTALFIAASLGHVKTFDALIKKGSDICFRTNSYSNIINFEHALKVSIEHQLWDYGILDIAAQNGHAHIVDYVLKHNMLLFDYPMKKFNSMMLLPIHLACKKGHLKVVQQLHTRYKWMLDWQCLYYASEIGIVSLVKYILENKIKDECRQCETYIHWIPKGQLRVQGQLLYLESPNNTYVLYDDWGNIACESALHVAVRANKIDVIKLLAGQSIHAAKCFDRGGRTPVISAIQYGFKDIVEYFIRTGLLTGNEKCAAIRHLNDSLKLHDREWYMLEKYFCETNMSVGHVIAKYDRLWVSDIMLRYGGKLDWNSKDSFGCYPIHKAACHSSITVLRFLLEQSHTEFEDYKCMNGSTPLHSAIACGSVSATNILLLKYRGYEQESKDVKMSYITHCLWTDYGWELARVVENIETNISIIIAMLITDISELDAVDAMNRNILHYAIQKGHFYVVLHLFSHFPELSKVLLKAKDENNRNPLYYAIDRMESYSKFVISPNIYGSNDLLQNPLDRMTPKEYSLLLTLNFMKQSNIIHVDQVLLKHLVRKQCLHIITFLLETSDHLLFKETSTLPIIIEFDRYGLQIFAYYAIVAKKITSTLLIKSSHDIFRNHVICNTCNELINKCHTHKIAHSYLKISNIVSLLQLNVFHNITVSLFFHKSRALLMSNCYDAGGYNVLERAVQGGSPVLVRYLIDANVRSNLEKDKLIEMALNGLEYRQGDKYIPYMAISKAGFAELSFVTHEMVLQEFSTRRGYSRKTSLVITYMNMSIKDLLHGTISNRRINSDRLASELITSYHNDIVKEKVCLPSARKFSIIHRLAFEGLQSTLELSVKHWGKDILECRNTDGFTPLYMSKIFEYVETTEFIESQGIKFQAPLKTAEIYFLFKLQFKYTFSRNEKKHIQCIMSYTKIVPNTTYKKIKAYNCARKVMRITKSKMVVKSINEFKWKLTFFIEMNTWNKIIMQFLKIANVKVDIGGKTSEYAVRDRLKEIALMQLDMHRSILKQLNTKDIVVNTNVAHLIQVMDAESRVCKSLRRSYKKMLLTLRQEVTACKLGCRIKETILTDIDTTLTNIDKYKWSTVNCTEIEEYCFERRAVMEFYRIVRETFRVLRLELISQAITESVFLPFSAERVNFSEIIYNHDLWLRLYHRYSYMNELQTSPVIKESFIYKSKSVSIFAQYREGIYNTIQFIEWNSNSAKVLQDYLTSKNKGDTVPT